MHLGYVTDVKLNLNHFRILLEPNIYSKSVFPV